MTSPLAPLRHRDFALIWVSALVSNIGSWMQTVSVGVLVTARTGQPGWTGLVAAAGFLPIGLLSPLGGVMADRVDRRRWLFATTVGETLFAAALAFHNAVWRYMFSLGREHVLPARMAKTTAGIPRAASARGR